MAADLTPIIETDASKPSFASIDGNQISKRPLSELIKADEYLKRTDASTGAGRGIMITKLIPPGTA